MDTVSPYVSFDGKLGKVEVATQPSDDTPAPTPATALQAEATRLGFVSTQILRATLFQALPVPFEDRVSAWSDKVVQRSPATTPLKLVACPADPRVKVRSPCKLKVPSRSSSKLSTMFLVDKLNYPNCCTYLYLSPYCSPHTRTHAHTGGSRSSLHLCADQGFRCGGFR